MAMDDSMWVSAEIDAAGRGQAVARTPQEDADGIAAGGRIIPLPQPGDPYKGHARPDNKALLKILPASRIRRWKACLFRPAAIRFCPPTSRAAAGAAGSLG